MQNIVEFLWQSVEGRCLLGLIVVVSLIMWARLFLIEKRETKQNDRVLGDLLELQKSFPEFSPGAIECRARAFCETFYCGRRARNLEPLRSHCTGELYDLLEAAFEAEQKSGVIPKVKVGTLRRPGWYRIQTPDENRPASVEMVATVFEIYNFGRGDRTFALKLVYTESGEWLVDHLVHGDFGLLELPQSDLGTDWLEQNQMPAAAEATLNPEKPLLDRSIRPWYRLSATPLFILAIFLLMLPMSVGLIYLEYHNVTRWERLLSEGERTTATITLREFDEADHFLIRYSFSVPESNETYSFVPSEITGKYAKFDRDAGFYVSSPGNLEVSYDKNDPTDNCAVKSIPPEKNTALSFGWFLFTVFGVVFLIGEIREELRAGCSPFWLEWKKRKTRYEKLRVSKALRG